jgi:serine O-acetyltransferase
MPYSYLRYLVGTDLYRYAGRRGFLTGLRFFIVIAGFRYTVLLRVYQWLKPRWWRWFGPLPVVVFLLRRYKFKFGFDISADLAFGPGLYIGHFGGIVIHGDVKIGRNCNLSHDVTLGRVSRGPKEGCPVIGDNVYIAPGVKIVGRIVIGEGAAVGANAVVVDDVPAGTTVAGVPARVVSDKGSAGYVNQTEYGEYEGPA